MNFREFSKKKILVTGGAGFVGSHVAETLVSLAAEVTVLDDFSNGNLENIAAIEGRAEIVRGSVTDRPLVEKLFSENRFDFVFHLAAVNMIRSIENPSLDLEINTLGTLHLLASAKSVGCQKFVYSSTGSVYGEPLYQPQDEAHPLNPVSPYGISKLAAEKYVLLWNSLHGLPTIALRYYNVYGPRQTHDSKGGVVGIFLDRVLRNLPPIIEGSGNQERCFTYVEDVVTANLLAALAPQATNGQAINIGTSEITTIQELAKLVLSICDSKLSPQHAPARKGDVLSFRPKLDRAKELLNYSPQTKFSVGLKKTKDWLAHKERTINA